MGIADTTDEGEFGLREGGVGVRAEILRTVSRAVASLCGARPSEESGTAGRWNDIPPNSEPNQRRAQLQQQIPPLRVRRCADERSGRNDRAFY